MIEPDFAILITAANRCIADRLVAAAAGVGGDRMRPSFGFVLRAVAAEEPTVSRLAELLGVTKQATSRLVDDTVTLGFRQRSEPRGDRVRSGCTRARPGNAPRARAGRKARRWRTGCGSASATPSPTPCEPF